jgi:molybdopterin converting factor small subunit
MIGLALEKLEIPNSIPMIILVNGVQRTLGDHLKPGDMLIVFPPITGG